MECPISGLSQWFA